MRNLPRNTAAVLVVTLFTGLAVFSAIQLGGRLFGTTSANAQTVTTQAAVQQPAESDGDDYGYDQGSASESSVDPYGQSSGSSQGYAEPIGQTDSGSSGGGTTQTCPATGCSASSCHATQ
jgi:hypothetical protein